MFVKFGKNLRFVFSLAFVFILLILRKQFNWVWNLLFFFRICAILLFGRITSPCEFRFYYHAVLRLPFLLFIQNLSSFPFRRATVRIESSEWILAEVSPAGSPRPRSAAISRCILRALLAATCTVLQRQVRSPRGKRWAHKSEIATPAAQRSQ